MAVQIWPLAGVSLSLYLFLLTCEYLWVTLRSHPDLETITLPDGKCKVFSGYTDDVRTVSKFTQKSYDSIPYYKGLGESLKKVCSKHEVQVYFKGSTTIENLLMAPKDQDPIGKKSGVIYRYISVAGWSVMKNILENPQELLQRGSENT